MKKRKVDKTKRSYFPILIVVVFALVAGALVVSARTDEPMPKPNLGGDALVREDSRAVGPDSASVTLVEFGDLQCPSCGSYHPVVQQLLNEFQGQIKFVFRNFPLQQHRNALAAAQAAEAAGNQGKYWEMYDVLYQRQFTWAESGAAKDLFAQHAQSVGVVDISRFRTDMDSPDIRSKISRDVNDGLQLRVDSTPTFFLNGQKISNPRSYEDFATLVRAELLKTAANPVADDGDYHVHANLKVLINDQPLDLSLAKYQSIEHKELDPQVHLHDYVGDVVHIHAKGVTLDQFLKSLGLGLSASCLVTDDGRQFCVGNGATLQMFVNGAPNTQLGDYQPQDLDRILISYGTNPESGLQQKLASVSDTACIYSLKCPERGEPPTESCVGGLGTSCD